MSNKYIGLNKGNKNVLMNVLKTSIFATDDSLDKKKISKSIDEVISSDKFKYLNDTNINKVKVLFKKKECKDIIEQKSNEFKEILKSKPKRLQTNYLKFSEEYKKTLSDNDTKNITETSKLVSQEWNKLSKKEKDKYKPSTKDKEKYNKEVKEYQTKILKYKASVKK